MKYFTNIIHILFSGPLLIYRIIKRILSGSVNQYIWWYIIHAAIFIPLLIWCGIKKTETPAMVFSILMAIGCAALGYHSIKLISSLLR